ncbi:hypothetical protein MNB_SV-13-556 [hydrothermal vent metagenome]|uniref:EF-hand domain-containing protein n=1 Tax=hydrothermal vent metagenome TaxID=652676 RepID=A0A1W1CZ16_9ZZZZ
MAKLDKKELDKLWKKFQSNKSGLTVDEYKSIADSAQTLYRSGDMTAEEAQKMMTAVSKYS